MLCKDPSKRLKIDEISSHGWFYGTVASQGHIDDELNDRRSVI